MKTRTPFISFALILLIAFATGGRLYAQGTDWGDAPDHPYPTLSGSGGAFHQIIAGFQLGTAIDPEGNGQPNANATGDDIAGAPDDEDGVTFPNPFIPGQLVQFNVWASQPGFLYIWIDFNVNGSWLDGGEYFSGPLVSGNNTVGIVVPASAIPGSTFARFRFTSGPSAFPGGAPIPTGSASDGEVEDYLVTIEEEQGSLDWGDAPDSVQVSIYPTLLANNGARHIISPTPFLGATVDSEPDGQPDPIALGDDADILYPPPNDDEDGVVFTSLAVQGQTLFLTVTANGAGLLDAWVDFNGDGVWTTPSEQVFTSQALANGQNNLNIAIPASAAIGQTFARFRYSSNGGLAPAGLAPDGEVEDYEIYIEAFEDPHKMHYPQYPDPDGWDVRACHAQYDNQHKILADDFLCTSNGLITHITFWGSWENDQFIVEDIMQGINLIHLSLHADIPDQDGNGPDYSKPEVPPLWERDIDINNPLPGWIINPPLPEEDSWQGWYDPNIPEYMVSNHVQYFRYDILIPEDDAFYQTNGTIYWLDISVETEYGLWGWKTSRSPHWNDDAVWGDRPIDDPSLWNELLDPIYSNSLDLAFIIDGYDPEPEDEYDWGDAPDPTYPTLGASVPPGASHVITPGYMLGTIIDPEPDGQPTAGADGDDLLDGTDDEDGVVFTTPLTPGTVAQMDVTADPTGLGGMLDAWIDFNGNGTWEHPAEHLFGGTSVALSPGLNAGILFSVPGGSQSGTSYARFRLSSIGSLPPSGSAQDGEVEDYKVYIEEEPLDFGDAPDDQITFFYPTLLANNGARHGATSLLLGNLIDLELDGQPTPFADGDDANNLADEDGIIFTTALISAAPATLQATVTGGSGLLQGWIDWNADGDWNEANEQIITDAPVVAGVNTVFFSVPNSATNSPVYARFRLSSTAGIPEWGYASDGEVEDYLIDLEELKWLQIPEQGIEGVDVNMTDTKLGDDFVCTASGPITDIHLWGSFYSDTLPPEGPGGLIFHLSIWSDVPAGTGGIPYSRPGQMLWSKTFAPGNYVAGHIYTGSGEWWHDPGTPTWIFPGDLNIYQFDFYPPENQAFLQIEGNIYWLVAEYAYEGSGSFLFGWKTTPDSFQDDAVFWDPALPPVYWNDLHYDDPQHPRYGESLELAFALSGVEGDVMDWGDAPDPTYPTYHASVGASHIIVSNFMLGTVIDAEMDGQPTAAADGDDTAAFDDEDGVNIGTLIRGSNATVNVFLTSGSGSGTLDAWVDFDINGTWGNIASEQIFSSQSLSSGANPLVFAVPANAALGDSFARFRLTQSGISTPGGAATEGEVEDYPVILLQPVPSPDIEITNLYFTASNTVATVQWNSQAGVTYQMQSNTNLLFSNSWINAGGYVPGPINWQTNNMSVETNKFYRITAPWTP